MLNILDKNHLTIFNGDSATQVNFKTGRIINTTVSTVANATYPGSVQDYRSIAEYWEDARDYLQADTFSYVKGIQNNNGVTRELRLAQKVFNLPLYYAKDSISAGYREIFLKVRVMSGYFVVLIRANKELTNGSVTLVREKEDLLAKYSNPMIYEFMDSGYYDSHKVESHTTYIKNKELRGWDFWKAVLNTIKWYEVQHSYNVGMQVPFILQEREAAPEYKGIAKGTFPSCEKKINRQIAAYTKYIDEALGGEYQYGFLEVDGRNIVLLFNFLSTEEKYTVNVVLDYNDSGKDYPPSIRLNRGQEAGISFKQAVTTALAKEIFAPINRYARYFIELDTWDNLDELLFDWNSTSGLTEDVA